MNGAPVRIHAATAADDASLWAMLEPVFRSGETYTIDPDIGRKDALAYWTGGERRVFIAEDAADGLPLGT